MLNRYHICGKMFVGVIVKLYYQKQMILMQKREEKVALSKANFLQNHVLYDKFDNCLNPICIVISGSVAISGIVDTPNNHNQTK